MRFNPAKLLIDPYARRLDGVFQWNPAVYDYIPAAKEEAWVRNPTDSAPFMPLGVVAGVRAGPPGSRPLDSMGRDHYLRGQCARIHHASPRYPGGGPG